jgi:hypothetical protein
VQQLMISKPVNQVSLINLLQDVTNLFVGFDADMNISYPRDIFSGQGHDIFFLFLHS